MSSTQDDFNFKTLFNQTVQISIPGSKDEKVSAIIEGFLIIHNKEGVEQPSSHIVVRVNPNTFTKTAVRYFKQFSSLNSNGQSSRLYCIPKEIVRQNVEGEIARPSSKKSKSK